MPLLWRRHHCCKCAGCAGFIGSPVDTDAGTDGVATTCCELGNHLVGVSTCTANSSCCVFHQTANGKTTLTVQTALFGTLVFDDASIVVCGTGSGSCLAGVSLAADLYIRAAKIVSGNVIEVNLKFICWAFLRPPLTLDCGPWNSGWTESPACSFNFTTNTVVQYALDPTVSYIREYSGASVIRSSETICGNLRTFCQHSGGSLVNALNSIRWHGHANSASAPIIPTGSAGSLFNNTCETNGYILMWSISPAPTVETTATIESTMEC